MGDGVLLALGSEMEIDHRGFNVRVAEIALDGRQRDARFQQMGGIGVPQGMNGGLLERPLCRTVAL